MLGVGQQTAVKELIRASVPSCGTSFPFTAKVGIIDRGALGLGWPVSVMTPLCFISARFPPPFLVLGVGSYRRDVTCTWRGVTWEVRRPVLSPNLNAYVLSFVTGLMENRFDGKPVWKLSWFDTIWPRVQLGESMITINVRMLLDSCGCVVFLTLRYSAFSEIRNFFNAAKNHGDDTSFVIVHWCDFHFVEAR